MSLPIGTEGEQDAVREAMERFAHRVRNILTTLKAGVRLLPSMPAGKEDTLRLWEDMAAEITRLERSTELAERYLRLTAAAATVFDLAALARDLAPTFAAAARARGVRLEVGAGGPFLVRADEALVRVALEALLQNAVDFSAAGGAVTVRPRRDGQLVALDLEDACGGVPSDLARRVGESFFTTRDDAVGMGLATAGRIARLCGGRLSWTPRAGHGCRFTLRLPGG